MTIPVPAVVHGVSDPTFASRIASKLIAADNVVFTEGERTQIAALSENIREAVTTETNRIEGQLTLMLAHVEGQYESTIARLKLVKIRLPLLFGAAGGFVVGFIASLLIAR